VRPRVPARRSSVEHANFFYEPVQLYFQPTDLVIKRIPGRLYTGRLAAPAIHERSGRWSIAAFRHFAICMGCNLELRPQLAERLLAADRHQRTRALNCGLYCFLVVAIDFSVSMTPPEL
jgi:hypothetical protein